MPELHFNEPPGPPTVHIEPLYPDTTSELTVVVDAMAVDPEAGEVGYAYTWFVDGEEAGHNSRIDASATSEGQTWRVVATATDGEFSGEPAEATVTIANSAPTVSLVSIEPTAPDTDADLVLSTYGTDVDGDTIEWWILWTRDGEDEAVYSGATTIPAAATYSGETWEASVTPYDGTVAGEAATIAVYIDNTVPEITSLRVLPTAPTVVDAVGATVIVEDPDSASQTVSVDFTWYVNGSEVFSESVTDGNSYLSDLFSKGDLVTVTAIPWDGFGYGEPWSSDPLEVVNSPPVLESVTLSPSTGYESDTFTCTPGAASDDDDDRIRYDYDWYVDGALVTSVTGDTITGTNFSKNQDIYCVVTPDDSDEDGASVTSDTVSVQNSVPTITAVSITPASPTDGTALQSNVTGATDADGDSISYTYAWTVNGSAISGSSRDLSYGFFDRGDEVGVTVTPSDSEGSGTPLSATTVEIDNALPAVSSVSISPSSPRTADILTATPSTATDADGDTVTYTYQWYQNDVIMTGQVNSTLPAFQTTRGERFYCAVTPNDGIDDGATRNSSSVTIGNTSPDVLADVSTGLTATECDIIELDATGSDDDDGDTLTYIWSMTTRPSGSTAATSSLSSTTAAEPTFLVDYAGNFIFSLTANDGTTSASDTVTVTVYDAAGNTEPVSVPDTDDGVTTIEQNTGCSSSGSGYVCTPCSGSFNIDATGSYDDEEDPLTYSWSTTSGYAVIGSATSETTTLTMRNMPTTHLGTYTYQATVTLRVQDCAGNVNTEDLVLSYTCIGN